jgi:hypothetical protein
MGSYWMYDTATQADYADEGVERECDCAHDEREECLCAEGCPEVGVCAGYPDPEAAATLEAIEALPPPTAEELERATTIVREALDRVWGETA